MKTENATDVFYSKPGFLPLEKKKIKKERKRENEKLLQSPFQCLKISVLTRLFTDR